MSLTEIEIHFERMKELSGSLTQTAAGLYGIADTAGISAAAQSQDVMCLICLVFTKTSL